TAAVYSAPSLHDNLSLSMALLRLTSSTLPSWHGSSFGTPCAARSHSALPGRRYSSPVARDSHAAYAAASSQLTQTAGWSPVCAKPGFCHVRCCMRENGL